MMLNGRTAECIGYTPPPKRQKLSVDAARFILQDISGNGLNTNVAQFARQPSSKQARREYVSIPVEYTKWDPERQNAWRNIVNEPDHYYFHYLPPEQAATPWTQRDLLKLRHCLKYNTPRNNQWGLFSFKFLGKTGKDCYEQYIQMMQRIATRSLSVTDVSLPRKQCIGYLPEHRHAANLPYFACSVDIDAQSDSNANASSMVLLAPRAWRNQYLFVNFKNTSPSMRNGNEENEHKKPSNCMDIKQDPPIPLSRCSPLIRQTIEDECKSLYTKFQQEIKELVHVPTRRRIRRKLRQSHKRESEVLFWRHAFLMASDLDSCNIAVPRVDFNMDMGVNEF